MFQQFTTYRRVVIVLLAMALAVPCSVKKDWKQQYYPESQQNAGNFSAKISCASFCSVTVDARKHNNLRLLPQLLADYRYSPITLTASRVRLPIPDHYALFKEKIPSHIRYQQFLT